MRKLLLKKQKTWFENLVIGTVVFLSLWTIVIVPIAIAQLLTS